ncbi:hypothetical protein BN871_BM_00270 [Paenibacillus sp. P22]|nr:hypothetical protein BN871_BM_00270 [Paenibacillus sp. P22]
MIMPAFFTDYGCLFAPRLNARLLVELSLMTMLLSAPGGSTANITHIGI